MVVFRSMGDESGRSTKMFVYKWLEQPEWNEPADGWHIDVRVCFACVRHRMQFDVLTMGFIVAIAVFGALCRLSSDLNGRWSRVK